MTINEVKSISITYEDEEIERLDTVTDLLDELIEQLTTSKCNALTGEYYMGDVVITRDDLLIAKRVIENIYLTTEMEQLS